MVKGVLFNYQLPFKFQGRLSKLTSTCYKKQKSPVSESWPESRRLQGSSRNALSEQKVDMTMAQAITRSEHERS